MSQSNLHSRAGWSAEETAMLFREIDAAGRSGRTVKSVFDKVAAATGRRPNSIRNYYYLRMKQNAELRRAAFVPFTAEEVLRLMRAMLKGQAEGRSVRSIAMELGNGDKKAMLRCQNKYRSVLRNDPEYVRRLVVSMQQSGELSRDPYGKRHRRLSEMLQELTENLSDSGIDASAFFGTLLTLSAAAAHPDTAVVQELSQVRRENIELRERYGSLCAISMSFVEKTPAERVRSLDDYVSELSRSLTAD